MEGFGFDGFDESLFETDKKEECSFESKLEKSLAGFKAKHVEARSFLLLDNNQLSSEPVYEQVNVKKAKGEYWYSMREYAKSSHSFRQCYDLIKEGAPMKSELAECLARSLLKEGKLDEAEKLAQILEQASTNFDTYSASLYLHLDLLKRQVTTTTTYQPALFERYTDVLGRQLTMHPFLANLWIRLAAVIELKHSVLATQSEVNWLARLIYSYVRVLYKSKLACNYDSSKLNTQQKMAVEWLESNRAKFSKKDEEEAEAEAEEASDAFDQKLERMLDVADNCDDSVKYAQARSLASFQDFAQKWFTNLEE